MEQKCDFATYIIKAIHHAKLYNPDNLPFLWRKETYYNKLITLFDEYINYNFLIKEDQNQSKIIAPKITNINVNMQYIIKDYDLAKKNAFKDYKFVDDGPQLTIRGLVFNK